MKGIINIGNSCYANSAIQLLFSSKIIRSLSKRIPELHNEMIQYEQMLKYNPKTIKKIVSQRNKIFENYNQQDSFEFILYYLTLLDEKDLMNTFGIQTTINIKCKLLSCLHESQHNEYELFLQLPVTREFTDLSSLYRLYKSNEILKDDNAYKCDKCNKKTIARKKIITSKWPDNLIIILKRFDNNMKKNNTPIDIPLEWRHSYTLKGGIIHSGSFNGGHYIYFGKEDNKWFEANDEHIREININDYMENIKYSYILLYERVKI